MGDLAAHAKSALSVRCQATSDSEGRDTITYLDTHFCARESVGALLRMSSPDLLHSEEASYPRIASRPC